MAKMGFFARINRITLCAVLLISLVVKPAIGPIQQVQQIILRVPQNFPSIQAAVDAAPEGATILIGPGTYVENITITKSLTLEGSGIVDGTILHAPLPPPENPVLTVQAPERVVTLRVRRLTVTRPNTTAWTKASIGILVLTKASLVLEQTAWVELVAVISAGPLEHLEARDSLFQENFRFVSKEDELAIQEAVLERNRFPKGANIVLYGRRLIAYDNTVICVPELSLLYPTGISFHLAEGGQAQITRNVVALCQNGIVVTQGVTKASAVIQDNQLLTNNRNIYLVSAARYLEEVYPRLDWSVEGNVIVSGGIGIHANIRGGIEGGQVQLKNNWIAWQRKQGIIAPSGIESLFGNGILLDTSLRRKELKEPLKIEISENRIENDEAWGLALNLFPGWDGHPDECNVYAPGEEQVFIDPEISGSGNEFRNNVKGDLCPADYPWPPGFRK
jgi:hypothetical protein